MLVVPYDSLAPVVEGIVNFAFACNLFTHEIECNLIIWPDKVYDRLCTICLFTLFIISDMVDAKMLLDKLVVVKFNGALGTNMGFNGPK